eukprot:2934596-Rhodomonas_salina.1
MLAQHARVRRRGRGAAGRCGRHSLCGRAAGWIRQVWRVPRRWRRAVGSTGASSRAMRARGRGRSSE